MLKIKLQTLEGIDEPFHKLYTEQSDGLFLLTGVEGMKTQGDVDNVTKALTKERSDHKALKEKYSILGDHDPIELLAQLDRVKELEAAAQGKIDESKINEMVEGRIRTKLGPIERELNQTKSQLEEERSITNEFKAKERKRTIHEKVREAAISSKMLPEAYDDVLLHADAIMDLTEDGRVITKDQVGVTPGIDPTVWLTEIQQKKRHWWPASQSGGSRGSGSGIPAGDNPWSGDGWNLTKQAEIIGADYKRAEQLARSAGTNIGGKRPVTKTA